jgi:hypothetical protein
MIGICVQPISVKIMRHKRETVRWTITIPFFKYLWFMDFKPSDRSWYVTPVRPDPAIKDFYRHDFTKIFLPWQFSVDDYNAYDVHRSISARTASLKKPITITTWLININLFQELAYFRFARQGASLPPDWCSILGVQVLKPKIVFQKFVVLIWFDPIPKSECTIQAIVSLQIVLCEIRWIEAQQIGRFDW